MKDLPASTNLTFLLISRREKKSRMEETAIGLAKIPLFDWKNRLLRGKQSVHLLSLPRDQQISGEALASVTLTNGGNLACERVGRIEVELLEYDYVVEYPNQLTIDKFIGVLRQREAREQKKDAATTPRLIVSPSK